MKQTPKHIELKVLYKEMSDLTAPECGTSCRCLSPTKCCDAMYCAMAIEVAAEFWDQDLTPLFTGHETLPFMGPNGCVLEPHLRPICTVHNCQINSIGFKRGDPEWTKRYFNLRSKIEEKEYDLGI